MVYDRVFYRARMRICVYWCKSRRSGKLLYDVEYRFGPGTSLVSTCRWLRDEAMPRLLSQAVVQVCNSTPLWSDTFSVLTAALVATDARVQSRIRHLRQLCSKVKLPLKYLRSEFLPTLRRQKKQLFLRDFGPIYARIRDGSVDLKATMLQHWPNLKVCGINCRRLEFLTAIPQPRFCYECETWITWVWPRGKCRECPADRRRRRIPLGWSGRWFPSPSFERLPMREYMESYYGIVTDDKLKLDFIFRQRIGQIGLRGSRFTHFSTSHYSVSAHDEPLKTAPKPAIRVY